MSNYQLTIDNGQLPEGYKQTEVGVIPEEWEVCYLHQISKKITDGEHATPKRATEGYYLLSARNVHDGRIDLIDVDFVELDEYQRIRKRCDPDTGDVLISCSGTIGRVAVLPDGLECVMVRSAALIKPDRSKTDSYFIQYVLQSRIGQIQIAQTLNQGAQANLFINHIEGLKVPFPHLSEQRSIAQTLSDVDALIAALEKTIAKKRAIKTATMQQLLTGKKRLPGFGEGKGDRQTEVGVIPEDWDAVLLDSVSKRGSGHTPDKEYPEYWNGDIKWISLKDSDRLDALYIYDTADKTTPLGIANSSAVIHPAGTVVLSRDAGVGKSAIMGDEMAVSQHFMAWRCSSQLNNYFLYYWLQAKKPEFERIAIGNTIKTIGLPYFKELKIPFPSLEEQQEIATVLSDMDTEIAALESRLAKTQSVKQGMMQELLTGRTRLI